MNVVVNGLMTNYQKVGEGNKSLVFLHGWGDTSKTFSKLIGDFPSEYTIVCLDLPGFGGTQAPESAWGLEDYANFVRDFLKKIDVKSIYMLTGHSFGGAVAIKAVSSKILSPQKLVLISASGIRNQQTSRKRFMRLAAKGLKLPLYLLPAEKGEKIKVALYGKAGSDILLIPHMRLTFSRIIKEDMQEAAATIKIPTLLIYGTKDRETPVKYGQLFSDAIQNSKLEVVEAGHFVHQEKADEVGAAIKEFLNA